MPEPKIDLTLGAKAARAGTITGVVTVNVRLSRGYIWMMKLRYIWAVIRAKVE